MRRCHTAVDAFQFRFATAIVRSSRRHQNYQLALQPQLITQSIAAVSLRRDVNSRKDIADYRRW